jgi:alginate O-acetyltransferase complex protein AlgI
MLFNSIYFLFLFLPVFFAVYFLLPHRFKNVFALAASILFYAWGAPKFVFVLCAAVVADFLFARQIDKSEQPQKKFWLLTAIGINIGILAYFKYSNFFIENLYAVLGISSNNYIKTLLPIGISFFTFHELSYLIDVYRGVKKPFKSIVNYSLYIFMFPQLIAGPIIRYNEIADQIEDRHANDTVDNKLAGFFRFVMGLAKKVLIADVIGNVVTQVFDLPVNETSAAVKWLGALLNIFHIYIDFSAYSDMAIGLALIMGFKFPENFNSPFIAQSVTEFWQRWHMSLNRWMRDYLYISLGGNRKGEMRTALNIFIVFFISGLWHGAQWKFVVWGSLFGIVVALERLFVLDYMKHLNKYLRTGITFFICVHILVVFTGSTLGYTWSYIKGMYAFGGNGTALYLSAKEILAIAIALVISFGALVPKVELAIPRIYGAYSNVKWYIAGTVATLVLLILSSSMLFITLHKPFLYFKF